MATLLHQPSTAAHLFQAQLVKCQQYWTRDSLFFPSNTGVWHHWDWRKIESVWKGQFSYVLCKEQHYNCENISGFNVITICPGSWKTRRSVSLWNQHKGTTDGWQPSAVFGSHLSSSLGLKPNKRDKKKRWMEFKDVWQMDSRDAGLAPSTSQLSCVIAQIMIQSAFKSKHSMTHSRGRLCHLPSLRKQSFSQKKKKLITIMNQWIKTLPKWGQVSWPVVDTVPMVTIVPFHQRNPPTMLWKFIPLPVTHGQ